MNIETRKDCDFFIAADRIMNGLPEHKSPMECLRNFIDKPIEGGLIMEYLRALRKYAYHRNTFKNKISFKAVKMLFWHRRLNVLSLKLGFHIGPDTLGYGVVLPHHGTIVINHDVRVGNFAVMHTSTCIAGGDKIIGDYFYLSTGSQIVGKLNLGDGVTVAAHSLVNDSFGSNILLAGSPAVVKRVDYPIWTDRGGGKYGQRVEKVLKLRQMVYGEDQQ